MSALVIDEAAREKLKGLRAYAESHCLTIEKLKELVKKGGAVSDVDGALYRQLDYGFGVVFSIEEQPAGLCRHVSVSVDRAGRLPHPTAVEMICQELGFREGPLGEGVKVWIEGEHAINVLEPVTEQEIRDGGRDTSRAS